MTSSTDEPVIVCPEPHFLLDITPWHRAFFRNLLDLLLLRWEPDIPSASPPGEYWPDVFVNRRLPFAPFCQSGLYHVFVVAVAWGLSYTWLSRPQHLEAQNPFQHSTITYYSVSEYLPPIKTSEAEPAKIAKRGDPAYAKQKIVSIRPNAESHRQTIVSPADVRLPQDIRLPNMVAWSPVPAQVPTAMAVHSQMQLGAPIPGVVPPAPNATAHSKLALTAEDVAVVPPAPVLDTAKLRTPPEIIARSVVPPAPAPERTRVNSSNLPLPSAVEPPVAPPTRAVRPGSLNIGNATVVPPAPKLPMPEQRARGSLMNGTGQAGRSAIAVQATNTSFVPPAPSLSGYGGGQTGSQQGHSQIIALSISPAAVLGPINLPQGNRSGTFAAGPEGRKEAAGTPDIKGGGKASGGGGTASGSDSTSVTGIYVERGPTSPARGGVAVSGQPPLPSARTTLASLAHPSIAELSRETRPTTAPSSPRSKVEQQVFGTKRIYSMTLNMPNLNSRGGSWIVRFAELKVTPKGGDLSAPVAMRKVDPAYPSDLIRDRVEGTVILYAIIRADGSVEGVRVLRSVDSRLDENARSAFAKWIFRPGAKNGSAVDIEAIVQIPFMSKPAF